MLIGRRPIERDVRLTGLDHRKLTYFYGGLDQKLTGVVEAEVIKGILA